MTTVKGKGKGLSEEVKGGGDPREEVTGRVGSKWGGSGVVLEGGIIEVSAQSCLH